MAAITTPPASIDSMKQVITINPSEDLPGGAIYVGIGDGYYDALGNQGIGGSATFTVDTTGPAQPAVKPGERSSRPRRS